MATKKKAAQPAAEKSTLIKIAETIGTVAGEMALKKDKMVKAANNVIESVKLKVNDLAGNKKPPAKPSKPAAKKTIANKAAPKKAAAKKAVSKNAGVVQKTAKKTVEKVAKKAADTKKKGTKSVKKTSKAATKKKAATK